MAEKIYTLVNKTKYNVGFKKYNGLQVNVEPGKRAPVTENDIANEATCMAKWIADGIFETNDDEVYTMLGIDKSEHIVSMTDDEIETKLKLPIKQFEKWINEQTSEAVMGRIFEVACKFDALPVKKMEIIERASGFSVLTARKIKNKE